MRSKKEPLHQSCRNQNKISLLNQLKKNFGRQKAPKVYEMNASICMERKYLLKTDNLFSNKTAYYIMPNERSVDIDNKIDLNCRNVN